MALLEPFTALVETLGEGVRNAFPALQSLAGRNISANQVLSTLKESGISIRRQTGLDLIALLRNKADLPQFVRTFGENAPIPSSLHGVSPFPFAEGAKFQYRLEITGGSEETPEGITVNSEVPLSANEVYGEAAATFRYPEGTGMSPTDLQSVIFDIVDARKFVGEVPSKAFSSFESGRAQAEVSAAYQALVDQLKAGKLTAAEFKAQSAGL